MAWPDKVTLYQWPNCPTFEEEQEGETLEGESRCQGELTADLVVGEAGNPEDGEVERPVVKTVALQGRKMCM